MCGIAGVYLREQACNADTLTAMRDTLVHRGPDDGRQFRRRAGGPRTPAPQHHRPGERPAADVHRRRPLRAGLQRRDLQLPRVARRSRKIRREVPHAFRHRGHPAAARSAPETRAVEMLNGIFAYALWDRHDAPPAAGARPRGHQAAVLHARRARAWHSLRRSRRCSPAASPAPRLDATRVAEYLTVPPGRRTSQPVRGRRGACRPDIRWK